MTATIPPVTSALLPAYSVQCQRCAEWIEIRCRCQALPGAILGAARAPATGHTAPRCSPTYREVGGDLPDRCPRCKAARWLEPPAYRLGQGTSRSTMYRRRAVTKQRKRRRRPTP